MAHPDLPELDRIRRLALDLLTGRDRIRTDETKLKELPLLREGRLCGLYFALRGPRDMLLTAIWDAQQCVLWCYDSSGRRFASQSLAVTTG